jgi:hypothetical protein
LKGPSEGIQRIEVEHARFGLHREPGTPIGVKNREDEVS